jgi:hypothetical protein
MATAQVLRPSGPLGQPDIDYAPDYQKYQTRRQRRLSTEKLDESLPPGFPERLESDLVWDGTDIAPRYNWVYELNDDEVQEIESALVHFKCSLITLSSSDLLTTYVALNKPLGYIDQSTFPLPNLHAALRGISNEIHNAFGFKVLRGLPVAKHSREENVIIYAGVSAHIATIRGRQDHQFDGRPADVVLNHIKDMSAIVDASKIGAPAYTTEKQVFHTDAGDVIALLCLEPAAKGGESKLSSSWKVYNELAKTRPDLIRTLTEDWAPEK